MLITKLIIQNILHESKIIDFPNTRQSTKYTCGANSIESILVYYGITDINETIIKKLSNTTEKYGTSPESIYNTINKFGLTAEIKNNMSIDDIKYYIDKNIPVILAIQAWADNKKEYKKNINNGHYVVTIGYNNKGLIFNDPSLYNKGFLTYKELNDRWIDKNDQNKTLYNKCGIIIKGTPKYNSKEYEIIK